MYHFNGDWEGGSRFDVSSNSGYIASSTGYNWPHTTISGSSRYLIVGVAIFTPGVSVLSVDYNGTPLTLLKAQASSVVSAEAWGMIAPPVGTYTVEVFLSGVGDSASVSSTWFAVDQTTPVDSVGSGQGTGLGANAAITTVSNNEQVFSVLATGALTVSAVSPQLDLATTTGATGTVAIGRQMASVSGEYTAPWTLGTSSNWAVAAVGVRPVTFIAPPPMVLGDSGGADVATMILGTSDWW